MGIFSFVIQTNCGISAATNYLSQKHSSPPHQFNIRCLHPAEPSVWWSVASCVSTESTLGSVVSLCKDLLLDSCNVHLHGGSVEFTTCQNIWSTEPGSVTTAVGATPPSVGVSQVLRCQTVICLIESCPRSPGIAVRGFPSQLRCTGEISLYLMLVVVQLE